MTTTATRTTQFVESYWRLAWQWQQEQRGNHGRWHDCLVCADLRHFWGHLPLPGMLLVTRKDHRVRQP